MRSLADSAQALAQRVVISTPANLGFLAQEEARAIDGRVTIVHKDGNVVADYGAGGIDMGADTASTLSPRSSSDMREITVQHRAFGRAVHHGNLYVTAPAGAYIVRLGYPLREIYDNLHMVRRSLLWATLLGLLLAILLAALLAQAVSHHAWRALSILLIGWHEAILARALSIPVGTKLRQSRTPWTRRPPV